ADPAFGWRLDRIPMCDCSSTLSLVSPELRSRVPYVRVYSSTASRPGTRSASASIYAIVGIIPRVFESLPVTSGRLFTCFNESYLLAARTGTYRGRWPNQLQASEEPL